MLGDSRLSGPPAGQMPDLQDLEMIPSLFLRLIIPQTGFFVAVDAFNSFNSAGFVSNLANG